MKKLLLLFFVICLLLSTAKSQYTSCTEINLNTSLICDNSNVLLPTGESEVWIKFKPNTINILLRMEPNSNLDKLFIYSETSNSCSMLTLMDSIYLSSFDSTIIGNLDTSAFYYLKFTRQNLINEESIKICLVNVPEIPDIFGSYQERGFVNACENIPPDPMPCNLICNDDFEASVSCVETVSQLEQLTECWGKVFDTFLPGDFICPFDMIKTPDYFNSNSCPNSSWNMGVPINSMGNQLAHSGNAYGGIVTYAKTDLNWIPDPNDFLNNFREYIHQKLDQPLIPGLPYNVSFWANLSDDSGVATKIGVGFSPTSIASTNPYPMNLIPVVESGFITNQTQWTFVQGIFIPTQADNYIYIGNFKSDQLAEISLVNPTQYWYNFGGLNPGDRIVSYYYIDDVTVQPVDDLTLTTPNSTLCQSPLTSTITATTVFPTVSITWSSIPNDLGLASQQNQNIVTVNPQPGLNTYTCTIVDIYGCALTETITITANQIQPIVFTAPLNSCCTNPTISVNPDYVNYTWSITPSVLFSGQGTNSISTVFDPNLSYEICLSAVDANGCIIESCVEIESCCTPIPDPALIGSNLQEFGKCSSSPLLISQLAIPLGTNYIIFYQDLIVDANHTFNNCNIRMAPGKKITINTGKQLYFSQAIIKALCPQMWDGIYVSDPTSLVNFSKNSEIWDAIEAVYSVNGGVYQISDKTKMVNNHRSLVVLNHSGTHPGVIEQSEVYTTAANLYSPHLGERMYQGVFISEGGDVTIGRKVRFDNMDYGVYSTGSNVNVYGNTFENINRPASVTPCPLCHAPIGTAIYATTKLPLANKMLRVGSIVAGTDNIIRFCYIGVETTRNMNLRVIENKFGFNEEAAVMTHTGNQRTVLIRRNTINFSKIGIHLVNMPLSNVNIDFNTIKNANLGCASPCIDNTGILIENTSPSTMSIEITDNTIERKKTGIWLRLVNGPNVNIHKLSNPTGNDISFPQLNTNATGTHKFYGIRLEKCDKVTVDENLISKAGLDPTANVFKNILGISTESSTNCVITENVTSKMGVGLWISGGCQGSIYACCTLSRAWNSVFFDNANITDQYISPTGTNASQANRYLNNLDVLSKISGTSNAVNWFYNSSGVNTGPNFNPLPALVTGLLVNGAGDLTTNACAQFFGPPGGGTKEALLPIIQNQRIFSSLQAENEFWDKDFGYNSLHQNYSWMNSGDPDDTIYQNYYNDLNSSCINKYCGVKQAIENEDYLLAESKNNQIQGNCQIEAHRKTSTQILLKFIQGDTLTNTDSVYLDEMAYSDPFIYGEAVMTARVILQLDPTINDLGAVQMDEEINDTEAETIVKLYPNPTKDYVTLEIKDDKGTEDYYFEIIDISGRTIFSNFTDKNKTILDLTSYENGIYFINVSIKGDWIERKKLIISSK